MKGRNKKEVVQDFVIEEIPCLFESVGTRKKVLYDEDWLKGKGYISKDADGCYRVNQELVKIYNVLDKLFLKIFKDFSYQRLNLPYTYSLETLKKMGYKRHSLCFAKNSEKASREKALIPAACLPAYEAIARVGIDKPTVFTLRNKVFRNEEKCNSIFTLKNFEQREFVKFGEKQDVESFLDASSEKLKELVQKINISASLNISTDIFYQNNSPEKALYQIVSKSKIELRVYLDTIGQNGIPLASCNNHRTHFSKLFNLKYRDNFAHTGCVAFGLSRWALAILLLLGQDALGYLQECVDE